MKQKTLIVFGTRKGTTTETCQLIAQVLKDDFLHDVEVVNIKSYSNIKKRLNDFDNLVIGTIHSFGAMGKQMPQGAKIATKSKSTFNSCCYCWRNDE